MLGIFNINIDNVATDEIETRIVADDPIVTMKPGDIQEFRLESSKPLSDVKIFDNEVEISVLGSRLGGDYYEAITSMFMQELPTFKFPLMLRFENTAKDNYKIYGIGGTPALQNKANVNPDRYDDKALDPEFLKRMVQTNAHELAELAEDNNAWPIIYYQADTLVNLKNLTAYQLKSITDKQEVPAFFPQGKVIGKLDFDQFGLKYDELTNIHILSSTFKKIFGVNERPENVDIIYIPFLDQFFEVNNVDDVKTAINSIVYYDITLKLFTDRMAVAKATDILDVSDLVVAENAMRDSNIDVQGILGTMEEAISQKFTKKTWNNQTFEIGTMYTLERNAYFTYGIIWYNNDWCQVYAENATVTISTLSGTLIDTINIAQASFETFVGKIAVFDKPLSQFDTNVYMTSKVFVTTMQPLDLVNNAT